MFGPAFLHHAGSGFSPSLFHKLKKLKKTKNYKNKQKKPKPFLYVTQRIDLNQRLLQDSPHTDERLRFKFSGLLNQNTAKGLEVKTCSLEFHSRLPLVWSHR